MKVFFFSFTLDYNSLADYFISLCNKLSVDNKVLIFTTKIRRTNIPLSPEIIVCEWPSSRPNRWADFIYLRKYILKYKPDTMVSIFGSVSMFLLTGRVYGVKNRIAWIRSLSTQFDHKRINVYRRSLIYRFATVILVNSQATKIDASRFYKIRKSKIKVLPNSVKDYNRKQIHSSILNDKKIIYVGRLHQTKGIDLLVNAIEILKTKFKDVQLDVIGRGPHEIMLQELVDRKHLSKHISFLGNLKKLNVLEEYRKSYCSIVPSYSEAFGFTVIEAMSMRTCVIGANNTGIKEIIQHKETGLLFETGNFNDLAKKIELIFNDVNFRNNLAEAGYQRFKKYYESEIAINRDYSFLVNINESN